MDFQEILSFYFAIEIAVLVYLVWKINDIKRQIDCMHETIHDSEESLNVVGTILTNEVFPDFQIGEEGREVVEQIVADWRAWEEDDTNLSHGEE